jgi:hypothetical protein
VTGHRITLALMLAVAGWLFYRVVRREITGAKVRVLGELNREIERSYEL